MYRLLCSPPSVWKTIQKLASSWGEVGKGERHGKLKRRPPWWQLIWQLYSRDDLARFPDSLALPTVGWGFGYSWWIASASLFLSMSLCLYLSFVYVFVFVFVLCYLWNKTPVKTELCHPDHRTKDLVLMQSEQGRINEKKMTWKWSLSWVLKVKLHQGWEEWKWTCFSANWEKMIKTKI